MYNELKKKISKFCEDNIEMYSVNSFPESYQGNIPKQWAVIFQKKMSFIESLQHIWQPHALYYEIVNILKTKCSEVAIIKVKEQFRLCYIFNVKGHDGTEFQSCYIGKSPIINSAVKNRIIRKDMVPKSYIKFLSIHNGFTLEGNESFGILGLSDLNYLLDENGEILKERIIPFGGNGCGDWQCFDLNSKDKENTVFWDHETQKIYRGENFNSFLIKFISARKNYV